ncbi:MAG: AAA family ATPase [Candidatus Aenigmarchaeota archaeon]|nr:AAA family ATPase [Candidatus Aenigmarchaeota archaeon]
MIRSVRLINWKSHEDSIMEFSGGTNVIIGSIGAGKSSVMDAICFGLFGTFPSVQTKKTKLDEIIMSKPVPKKDARVTLCFDFDGKEYTVERQIDRGKGTSYSEIREGDKLLESPNSQRVTDFIQKILKIDYELFSKAIYSEQNSIDYFLKLSKGERMKKIDNLLKIDKFERARSNLVTLRNRLLNKKNTIEKIYSLEDEKSLEKKYEELKKIILENSGIIKKLEEDKIHFESKYQEISEKIEYIENDMKRIEVLRERINNLDNSIKENKKIMENLRASIKDFSIYEIQSQIQKYEEMKKTLEERINLLKKTLENYIFEQSKIKSEIDFVLKINSEIENKIKISRQVQNKLKEIESKYPDLPENAFEIENRKLKEIESKISVLNFRIKDLEDSYKKLSEINGICPVCNSEISKEKKSHILHMKEREKSELSLEIENLNNEKKTIETKISQIKLDLNEFEKLKNDIKDLDSIIIDYEKNKKSIDNYSKVLLEIESKVLSTRSSIDEATRELDKINKDKFQIQHIKDRLDDLQRLKESNEKMQKEIEINQKEFKHLLEKYKDIDFNKMKNEKIIIAMKISEIKVEIQRSQERIENGKKQLEEINVQIEKVKKIKKEIEDLQNAIKNLDIYEIALEQTQNQLRQEFIETVNSKMSEIWSDIYPYSDYVDIRLYVEDDDYVLQLSDSNGDWMDVDRVSGGERSIASLALRIAFSLVLVPHLNWLILDEPTHNLDAKSVEKLGEILRDRINDFVQQVFLITHEKSLESAAKGEIYHIKRNKDKDEPSQVERITEI